MFSNQAVRGTRIHVAVKDQINGGNDRNPKDPNFRAEISLNKSKSDERDGGIRYEQPGSIRIDVLENRDNKVVCVYDLKTGRSGISPARFKEIYSNVNAFYPNVEQIFIIEVRPME